MDNTLQGRRTTLEEVGRRIKEAKNVLIMTHDKADGDAVGSSLGLAAILRRYEIAADAFIPDGVPDRYQWTLPTYINKLTPKELEAYDLAVIVDSARDDRVGTGKDFSFPDLTMDVLVVDHHMDNSATGTLVCVEDAAACAVLIAQLATVNEWRIDPGSANWLYLGLLSDTGSFRFSNTDAAAFECAALLVEAGAEPEKIANVLFFAKPLNQQKLEADLLDNHLQIVLGGRYAYAFISDKLLHKYRFDMRDGEGIIERLREIEGVKVAALFYMRGSKVKASLRSKDPEYPIGPVARALGGGGHNMAAGVTLDLTPDDAQNILLVKIAELLD